MYRMWKILSVVFIVSGIASIVVTEILRSVVDRKRFLRDGMGGTQDIAFWGCVVLCVCNLGGIVCLVMWLVNW